jgi:hypothetical protein
MSRIEARAYQRDAASEFLTCAYGGDPLRPAPPR